MSQIKRVKMEDIANELGVSIVTVSNALKGKKGVGESLRTEIVEKAEAMGYQIKNSVPAKEKVQKNYQIGIIIAERYVKESSSFYMEIYKQVAQSAIRQGCLTALEIVELEAEKQKKPPSLFQSMELDGLLLIGEMQPEYVKKIYGESAVPVVCVDFYDMNVDMDYIVTDGFHGMQMVTQRLIDAGHRDIGFVGTPRSTNSIMDRYMGYCKALQMNGIREKADRVYFDREEGGYGSIRDIELTDNIPTAFVCNCDSTAVLLIEQLEKRGLKVPDDISVAGFDHYCNHLPPHLELLTYESDVKALAQISVNTLVKRIEKKKEPEGIRIVEGKVIEGNTVKRFDKE